ncbi:MAG: hypothetical protein HC927_00775 [Deltaproteobacteria bacterium]|nr:hypothetical protein [Deltaproteobacteria bacterium]
MKIELSILLVPLLACTPVAGGGGTDDTEGHAESETGEPATEAESESGTEGETETDDESETGETDSEETDSEASETESNPATCMGSTAIICEDFEVDDDFAGWDLHVGGHTLSSGDVERDATHAHGQGALRTWADFQDNLTAWGWIERSIPTTDPDLFVRAYAYVPATSINEWYVLFALNQNDGYASLGLALEDGTLATVGWGDTHQGASDTEPFPTDQWVCLEFQVHYGDSSWFSAWRDDELVVDMTPVTADRGVLDQVFFGLYGGNNEFGLVEFWLDDLVVDTARVGCD